MTEPGSAYTGSTIDELLALVDRGEESGVSSVGFDLFAGLAREHAALLRLASDPQIRRDLLWMAEGRKKRDRKATDDLLAALDAMGGHQ